MRTSIFKSLAIGLALISMSATTTGCLPGSGGNGISSVSTNPLKATTVDEKALSLAEIAFKAADDAIMIGIKEGFIKGQKAKTIKGYRTLAESALEKAHDARRLGQSATILEQAVIVQELVAKIFSASTRSN